jgi:hypothetical protein
VSKHEGASIWGSLFLTERCKDVKCPALGKCIINAEHCTIPEDMKNPNKVEMRTMKYVCGKCGKISMTWLGKYTVENVRETSFVNSLDMGMQDVFTPLFTCLDCGFESKDIGAVQGRTLK